MVIDVADAQAACFPGAQPESVAQGEDGVVGLAPAPCPRVVGQGRRGIEQQAGLGGVEQEGRPPVGFPPPGRAQRRGVQPLLGHGPVQEAAEVADEVVEAAGPWSWPGRGELIQEAGGELAQVRHAVLAGERQQQAQRGLLRPVFAAERPLVSEEVADGGGEVVVHDRTSSPSPRATWRSASTATFNGTVGYQTRVNEYNGDTPLVVCETTVLHWDYRA